MRKSITYLFLCCYMSLQCVSKSGWSEALTAWQPEMHNSDWECTQLGSNIKFWQEEGILISLTNLFLVQNTLWLTSTCFLPLHDDKDSYLLVVPCFSISKSHISDFVPSNSAVQVLLKIQYSSLTYAHSLFPIYGVNIVDNSFASDIAKEVEIMHCIVEM